MDNDHSRARAPVEKESSPVDASQNAVDAPTAAEVTPEWVQCILGRDWEVFWNPNSDYVDDWYDAVVQSYLRRTPTGGFVFSVSFVGETDRLHEMQLTPEIVRPRHHTTPREPTASVAPPPPSREWALTMAGKECEVNWKQSDAASTNPAVDQQDDWYGAFIHSFIGINPAGQYIFSVAFAGDPSKWHEIPLTPAVVRPSRQNRAPTTTVPPTTVAPLQYTVPTVMPPHMMDQWARQLIGTTCQVFWNHPSTTPNAAAAVGQGWYRARIQSYIGLHHHHTGACVFYVAFLGGDDDARNDNNLYELPLTPNLVRYSADVPDIWQWVQNLVGKECEIFWKQQTDDDDDAGDDHKMPGTTLNTVAAAKGDEMSESEADWYDAHIQSMDHQDGKSWVFKLQFAGEDRIYDMPLQPTIVRPSARAWIRRTKALLEQPDARLSFEEWEKNLPSDTSLPSDEPELERIRHQVRTQEFPLVAHLPEPTQQQVPHSSLEDHEQIVRLVELIRSQLYLRQSLAPTEETSVTDDHPSEPYVDFLVKSLKELEACCQWYNDCWVLHAKLLRSPYSLDDTLTTRYDKLNRTVILEDSLGNGKQAISTLISMDVSVAGCKRKRKARSTNPLASVVSQSSRQRSAKRLRRNKGFDDFWQHAESGERIFNPELETEDFLSADLVQRLVDKTVDCDLRWYVKSLGIMLRSLSRYIVTPLVKWERRAAFYLGDKDFLDVEATDGETSEEDIDEDEDNDSTEQSNQGDEQSPQFVKPAEIQSLVDSADNAPIVFQVDLSDSVRRLQEKLHFVTSFEERAWRLVETVLDDTGTSWGKREDETCTGLVNLLAETVREGSPLKNVEPIGLGMTRQVIKNAIVYREWFLDLRYCEAVRERVAFVESIVSRLSKLPPLALQGSSSGDTNHISRKLDVIAPRVQALSAKYIDHVALFNRYRSMLGDRSISQDGRKGLWIEENVRRALKELKQVQVLSMSEELLAVRLDVLVWERMATSVFAKEKPLFSELKRLYESLGRLLEGRSASRADLVRERRPNSEVDLVVMELAREDMDSTMESFTIRTRSLFLASSMWKRRADSILGVLRAFGNRKAGGDVASPKPPSMIDARRIEDLIQEYDALEVDLSYEHSRLRDVHEEATCWASTVTKYLTDSNNSFKALLSELQRIKISRPKGIIIDPTRQVVDLLDDLLRWRDEIEKSFASEVEVHSVLPLLVQGVEVIRLYSESSGRVRFTVPADAQEFLSSRFLSAKKGIKVISRSKLEATRLSRIVLGYMTSDVRDSKESNVLFSALFWIWQLYVDSFVRRSSVTVNPDRSLTQARELIASEPVLDVASSAPDALRKSFTHVAKLNELIQDGERTEKAACDALTESKTLLRSFRGKHDEVKRHHTEVKELLLEFKTRCAEARGLVLDKSVEQQLERDVRVFSWLVRSGLCMEYRLLPLSDALLSYALAFSGPNTPVFCAALR